MKEILRQLPRDPGGSIPIESAITKLAILTTLKRRYLRAQPPTLTLGTIIRARLANIGDMPSDPIPFSYWICVQPRCDSVRIPETGRAFPFLPCDVIPRNLSEPKFDLVVNVPGESDSKWLKIGRSLFQCKMMMFKPEAEGAAIVAKKEKERFYFPIGDELVSEVEWIGELKFEQAQRVAQLLGTQIGRVGLNETEWLRKVAPRN